MKIAKKIAMVNIEQQVSADYSAPMVLSGVPGSGKTQLLRDIAKENNYEFVLMALSTMALHHFSGLPSETTNNKGELETTWSVPEVIAIPNNIARKTNKKVILVLDDMHSIPAGSDALNMLLQLLLERSIGQHKLEDNIAILGTTNDSEESAFEGFPSAVLNRIALFCIKFDFQNWFENFGAKLNPIVGSFVKSNQDVVTEAEDNMSNFGTSRSISFLSTLLNGLDKEFIEENAYKIACQFMTTESAIKFESHAQIFYAMNLEEKVKSREDLNISKMKTLDKYMYAYIASYVKTEDDMKWFISQMTKYIDEQAFIGLSAGIIYDNYSGKNINDATRYFITSLLDDGNGIFKENKNRMFEIMKKYLL